MSDDRLLRRCCVVVAIATLVISTPGLAATIVVDEVACTLVDAMTSANTDTSVGGCTAGDGTDVIVLATDVTLTDVDNATSVSDANGLPLVVSDIVVQGEGHTIQRVPATFAFRFFAVEPGASLVLEDLTMRGGLSIPIVDSPRGGAIKNSGILVTSDVELRDNEAAGGLGGAVWNGSLATIARTVFVNNSGIGGGLANFGDASVSACTFSGNGFVAAGIYNEGTLHLTNSTISGNDGHGILNAFFFPDGHITVTNSTIAGNSTGYFSFLGTASMSGTIFANGSSGTNCFGIPIVDEGGNFADDTSCGAAFSPLVPGVDLDALLADNGGPTQTHALLPGSVAIDAAGVCGLDLDQRGFLRWDGVCDSGAFEFDAIDPDDEGDDEDDDEGDDESADGSRGFRRFHEPRRSSSDRISEVSDR